MSAERLLRELGGAARYAELLRAGLSRGQLLRAMKQGTVTRVHHGTYALAEAVVAAKHSATFRATTTCLSRCAKLDLPLLASPTQTHLWVPRSRSASRDSGRPVQDVVLHRLDSVDEQYAGTVVGALDIAGLCTPLREHVALIDAAMRRAQVQRADLANFRASPRPRSAQLLELADLRAESFIESLARVDLRLAGLAVEPQVRIPGVGHLDLLVEGIVGLETDGDAFHSSRSQTRNDKKRDRTLAIRGLVPVRVTYEDVVGSMEEVVKDVVAILWRRGWTPKSPAHHDALRHAGFLA